MKFRFLRLTYEAEGGTDVLETGYTVKNSMLNEKLEKLAPEDRNRIYEVIDTLVKQSKQILP